MRRAIALLVCCLASLGTAARADDAGVTLAREAHTGLFARVAVGFGGSRLASRDSLDARIGGASALYDFALGWTLRPRLALHATYFGTRVLAPGLRVGGEKTGPDSQLESSLNGIGLGVTYRFASHLYVSPSFGVAIIEGVDAVSPALPAKKDVLDPGFAAGLTSGYEWQLSESVGLGVAVCLAYFRARDGDGPIKRTWQGFGAGPLVSFTYD